MYKHRINLALASSVGIAGLTAEQIYTSQKDELRRKFGRLIEHDCPLDFDVKAIARMMHNIACTAEYFGDGAVGSCTDGLEIRLRAANDAGEIRYLCTQMLTLLDRGSATSI